MSESKLKQERQAATHDFHLTHEERVRLTLFFLESVKPANRSDVKRYERIFEAFRFDEIAEKLNSEGLKPDEFRNQSVELYHAIPGDMIDYLFEKINAPSTGMTALVIARVTRRIEELNAGLYRTPDAVAGLLPAHEAQPEVS